MTDGQTDGQTHDDRIYLASAASRGKRENENELLAVEGSNIELVNQLEELLSVWQRQIEQVLAESEQVRREADDVGPSAELHYWKTRMAKFNQ